MHAQCKPVSYTAWKIFPMTMENASGSKFAIVFRIRMDRSKEWISLRRELQYRPGPGPLYAGMGTTAAGLVPGFVPRANPTIRERHRCRSLARRLVTLEESSTYFVAD